MRVSAAHPIKDSAVWTVCVDSLHGQPEWTVCVDGLYGQSAWTVYMDSLCGQPVGQSAWRACGTVCVESLYGQSTQTHSSFSYLEPLLLCLLPSGQAQEKKCLPASGDHGRARVKSPRRF
jgi:hypothetical protein